MGLARASGLVEGGAVAAQARRNPDVLSRIDARWIELQATLSATCGPTLFDDRVILVTYRSARESAAQTRKGRAQRTRLCAQRTC
jgi:hypothetical protein